MDLNWMPKGGVLLDGSGDLAMGDAQSSLIDMVRTRLKAALNGWKAYTIGADLKARIGDTQSSQLATALKRQVEFALSNSFLPRGSFTIKTLDLGPGWVQVLVYLSDQLVATATANQSSGTLVTT